MKELSEEIKKYNEKHKDKQLILPKDYNIVEKARYLQATGFKSSKTIELLLENIEWRSKLIPPAITPKVVELLNCGFMYVHGRDNNYRPILVINAEYYIKLQDKYSFNDWLQFIIFFMEYLVNELLIPGQVENWNIISDLSNVSMIFLPKDMKRIMGVLQSNYRCRLYVNYILGMSTILKGIWNFVKTFLDEMSVKKVQFIDDKNKSVILNNINEEQVERRFGGTAPNVVPGAHNLFPPIFPSANFQKKTKKVDLLTEEKYKEMYKANKLTVVNEYFVDKWKKGEEEELLKKQQEMLMKKQEDERVEKEMQERVRIEQESKNPVKEIYLNNDKLDLQINPDNFLNYKIDSELTSTNRLKFTNMKYRLKTNNNIQTVLYNSLKGANEVTKTPEIVKKIYLKNDDDDMTQEIMKHLELTAEARSDNTSYNFNKNGETRDTFNFKKAIQLSDNTEIEVVYESNKSNVTCNNGGCIIY
jgi:hypothetical protein